jgi:hypothetical protein
MWPDLKALPFVCLSVARTWYTSLPRFWMDDIGPQVGLLHIFSLYLICHQNASHRKWRQAWLQRCPASTQAQHSQVAEWGNTNPAVFCFLLSFNVYKTTITSLTCLLPFKGWPHTEFQLPKLQRQLQRNSYHCCQHGHRGELRDGPGLAQGGL